MKWRGWIEGTAADGVRRLRMEVQIEDDGSVTVLSVGDATDWCEAIDVQGEE